MTLDSPPLLALVSKLDLVTDLSQPTVTLNKAHVHSLNKHWLRHLLRAGCWFTPGQVEGHCVNEYTETLDRVSRWLSG